MRLQEVEKGGIPDQGRLDRFGQAAAPVAIAQGRQEREVVDHGKRRGEGADVVLLAEGVDAILHPDRGVVLREHGRGHANQTNAAMRGCGRKPGDVQHRPAADRDDVGVTAECRGVDGLEQPFDLCRIVLGLLASGDDHYRPGQLEGAIGVR